MSRIISENHENSRETNAMLMRASGLFPDVIFRIAESRWLQSYFVPGRNAIAAREHGMYVIISVCEEHSFTVICILRQMLNLLKYVYQFLRISLYRDKFSNNLQSICKHIPANNRESCR